MTLPWQAWPPSSGSSIPAPVANAGADFDGAVGAPSALDGSASSGIPPYTYLWTVISAPVGGAVVFDDDTDPTTNATPDTEGEYTLRLTVTDAIAATDSDDVVMTAEAALPLDDLSVTPYGAYSFVERLRTGFTDPPIRIMRYNGSTNPETDIAFDIFVPNQVDYTAIETFCGTDPGIIVTVYDQSGNGNDLSAVDPVVNGVVFWTGAAFLTGFGSRPVGDFNGANDGPAETNGTWLTRADTCGLGAGNPGIVGYHNAAGGIKVDDSFRWYIGEGGGAGYSHMTSLSSGDRDTLSTLSSNCNFTNDDFSGFHWYRTIWVAGSPPGDGSITRDDGALPQDGDAFPAPDGTAPVLSGSGITRWGTSPFADGWFSNQFRGNTLILMPATMSIGDTAILDAYMSTLL